LAAGRVGDPTQEVQHMIADFTLGENSAICAACSKSLLGFAI
jgi:hypothetical protein